METVEDLTKRRDQLRQNLNHLQYCDRLTQQNRDDRDAWSKELAQVAAKLRALGAKP